MAFSSTTSTCTHVSTSEPYKPSSKLDQTTLENLYRQGYQADELILRACSCIKCDSMTSCPGMLYITTEMVYFISKSNIYDMGFHLTSLVSLQIEDGSYPLLTFVTEYLICSFGSLYDRQDLIELLRGAFPKLSVGLSTGNPDRDFDPFSTTKVSKTAILNSPIDNEELIRKREKELTLLIQLLKANTCQYFLANNYCPIMIFCEKEHLTKDQLDSRIYTQEIAKDLSFDVLQNADFLSSDDSIVRSKQDYTAPLLPRHQRPHSFSESYQNNSVFPNLNLSCLGDLTSIDFTIDKPGGGLRRSNSMEVMDSTKTTVGKHIMNSTDFLGAPIIRSISSEQIAACSSPDFTFSKSIPRNISPTLINFLNDTLDQKPRATCTPENNSPSSLRCVSPESPPPLSTLTTPPFDHTSPETLSPRVSPVRSDASTPPLNPYSTFYNSDISLDSNESITSPQPGDPCPYFMSGFCRKGDQCPYSHTHQQGMIPFNATDLTFPQKLTCLSDKEIGRDIPHPSDKIILSPSILVICERNNFQYPITFSLTNLKTNQKLFVGVLEFTSTQIDVAYIPKWIFHHLGIAEGEEVEFKHEDIPKGVFCRLQPLSSAWLSIPYEKRTEILEFWLKKYQNLTVGMRIEVQYEMNKYSLKVLNCKPADGICIVNADISTDIIEPLDCNELYSPEEGQAQRLYLGYPKQCKLALGMYRHFVLLYMPNNNHPERIRISLTVEKGDPDLYVSQTHTAPSQVLYQWCSQDVGCKELRLSSTDQLFNPKESIYVGVMSFTQASVFSICFHRDDGLQMSPNGLRRVEQGNKLRPLTTNSLDELVNTHPNTHVQCTHCGVYMPPLRLAMHERHCKLSTYRCPDCNECIPFVTKEKHSFIMHKQLTCCCGKVYTQYELNAHQLNSCVKRTIKCTHKWCNLSFPMDEIHQHETTCGLRVTPCPICNDDAQFMELESHLFAFHSIDVRRINWDIPLNAQLLKKTNSNAGKLNCKCGENFLEIDDLQVHELTSCLLNNSEAVKANDAAKLPTENGEIPSLPKCEKPQEETRMTTDANGED
ncbi:hypothetical protein LOD99_5778 [Oopsacas minuta]|uniref:C3H1-type domain-containing protein n=1 Tax=Oopsacas minuta TaxID=111878 RepID=A0AAV7JPM4_9METZ|nr:hypothetical protein LOD99_5778 [Oopsacas minuta]